MCCHDTRHTGLSPYLTANSPGIIKWRLLVSSYSLDGGIAIDKNGIIYFGDNDGYVDAVFPNGTMKWRTFICNDFIETTPAIGADGTIYIGSWNWNLYAFNPNGTVKWSHSCGSIISYGSPVIADDGTIYVTTTDPQESLIALNPDGTEKWRYHAGWFISSAPVIGLDGGIFFGSGDTYIYAVNPNGTLRWRYKTGDRVMGSASIGADGTVYMPSWDGYLYALNPINGSLIWRVAIKFGSESNPAIGPDGTIYVGESYFYAINTNGTVRWSLNVGGAVHWSCPAVSTDGIVYIGAHIGDDGGGKIIAINPNGTKRWEQILIAHGHIDSSPAIAADGTVYIGTSNLDGPSYLFAFGRGPLNIDAYGPYIGFYQKPVQFTGDAFGGTPPYTYHWDFGDGNTSNQQNPSHTYSTVGNYTATLTVTDNDGNHSTDTAAVAIVYEHPYVKITKPLIRSIYFFNIRLFPYKEILVIGPITIEATATQTPFGIAHVDFLLDDSLKVTDTQAPYQWTWKTLAHGEHKVSAIAYDASGNSTKVDTWVIKYF